MNWDPRKKPKYNSRMNRMLNHMNAKQVPQLGSLVIQKPIEAGQVVKFTTDELHDQFIFDPYFLPSHFIYVGAPDMWLLNTHDGKYSGPPACRILGSDLPCDSFRPGTNNEVGWPLMGAGDSRHTLTLIMENRSDKFGVFVSRLAGKFTSSPYDEWLQQ